MKLEYPYKSETNHRYSKCLFWEMWINMPIDKRAGEPPFTLYQKKDGYICLREEYIADGDPTGYTTAMRIFGEYAYWKYLMGIRWFVEAKKVWDEELDAKLESEGLRAIRTIANDPENKGQLQASKYLANLEYKKNGLKRGRPSSEEVEGRLKQEAQKAASYEDDAARIGLVGKTNSA